MWPTLLWTAIALTYVFFVYAVFKSNRLNLLAKVLLTIACIPNLVFYALVALNYQHLPKRGLIAAGTVAIVATAAVFGLIKIFNLKAYSILEILVGLGSAVAACSTLQPQAPVTVAQCVAIFGSVYLLVRGLEDLDKAFRKKHEEAKQVSSAENSPLINGNQS